MKVITKRHVTHTLQLDDDTPLNLQYEPIGGTILVERVGDKIVVGYLVQDDGHGCNPMADHDSNGKLYTRENREQGEIDVQLGLDGYGGVDIDKHFILDGLETTLRELAQANIESLGESDDEERDVETLAVKLYEQHWQQLARWVVPVDYRDYGSSGMRISVASWDGNPDRPPNAVWVADKDARENLEWEGKVPTQQEINDYAKGVIEEYEKWCNGEVYGCVVEIHELGLPEYGHDELSRWRRLTDEDLDRSCWGYIGFDYAKETLLNEFFNPNVKEMK